MKRIRFDYFTLLTVLVGLVVAMNLLTGDVIGAIIVGGGIVVGLPIVFAVRHRRK